MFTKVIMGIKFMEAPPKATVSYGDVAMSFPYAKAILLISFRTWIE
jgi:hypothetical protein